MSGFLIDTNVLSDYNRRGGPIGATIINPWEAA